MKNEPLASACTWISKALPEPTPKDLSTQIGVHIEEFTEFLNEVALNDYSHTASLEAAVEYLNMIGDYCKSSKEATLKDRVAALDALCDNIQTAASVAHCAKLDLLGGMSEVVASNFSKFTNGEPSFNENRKIIKGPDYFKPELANYV